MHPPSRPIKMGPNLSWPKTLSKSKKPSKAQYMAQRKSYSTGPKTQIPKLKPNLVFTNKES